MYKKIIILLLILLLLPISVFAVSKSIGPHYDDTHLEYGNDGLTITIPFYDTTLKFGRDADNLIDFTTDNKIVFRVNAADKVEMISTGELDMNTGSVGFTLQTDTGTGAKTIDWRLGNKFKFTFGAGNVTFTFIAPTNPCTLMLTIIQDGTGSRTITWPGTVKWPGGTEGVLSTAANARDKVALDWDGSQYDAQIAKDFK